MVSGMLALHWSSLLEMLPLCALSGQNMTFNGAVQRVIFSSQDGFVVAALLLEAPVHEQVMAQLPVRLTPTGRPGGGRPTPPWAIRKQEPAARAATEHTVIIRASAAAGLRNVLSEGALVTVVGHWTVHPVSALVWQC
jgi:hypothetical protein